MDQIRALLKQDLRQTLQTKKERSGNVHQDVQNPIFFVLFPINLFHLSSAIIVQKI